MDSVGKTHVGKVRKNNEDYYYVDGEGLYVLADGMGGHLAGDVASKSAVDYIRSHFYDQSRFADLPAYLNEIVLGVNRYIYTLANSSDKYKDMGTTLIVAYVDAQQKMFYAHVGDSRLYLYRQGSLQRLTKDHSLVEELLSKGAITESEAQSHPQKNIITRAIGVNEDVQVDIGCKPLEGGDVFLICTDGLSNMIADDNLRNILEAEQDINTLADRLINEANKNGGSDNITVVIGKI